MDDEQVNYDEGNDDYCTSPISPLGRRHQSFLSSSDDSLASTVTDVSTAIYRNKSINKITVISHCIIIIFIIIIIRNIYKVPIEQISHKVSHMHVQVLKWGYGTQCYKLSLYETVVHRMLLTSALSVCKSVPLMCILHITFRIATSNLVTIQHHLYRFQILLFFLLNYGYHGNTYY